MEISYYSFFPRSYYSRRLQKAVKKANINKNISPHSIRHLSGNYIKDKDMHIINQKTKQEERIKKDNKTLGKVVHLDEDIVRLLEVYSLFTGVNEDKIVEEALSRHFNSNGFLDEIKSKFE